MNNLPSSSINQSQSNLNLSNIPDSHQQHIQHLLNNSKSDNTKRAYDSDWNSFTNFCSLYNHNPIPASETTIVHYIAELSKTHKHSTIKRHLASISKAHKTAKQISPLSFPLVIETMDGISRTKGSRQTPKKALLLDDLKRLIDSVDVSTLSGKRDKALILLGFSIASRRSELVSINVEDITFTPEGMDINIYESKTDRYITKSVLSSNNSYCPIVAVKEWIQAARIKSDSLFRSIKVGNNVYERLSDQSVADVIKKYAEIVGLDPKLYAGHSLRSGFATSASNGGYDSLSIRKTTGHNTITMVDRYVQEGNKYKNNATSILSKL